MQLRFPRLSGAANTVSLEIAQQNYREFGAAERRKINLGREPFETEYRDEGWRPLDSKLDNVEEPQRGMDYADSYPESNFTVLYYWRPTYWRRLSS